MIWRSVIEDSRATIHVGLLGIFTCNVWVKVRPFRRNIYGGPVMLYPLGVCDNQGNVINRERIENCHCQAYDDLEIL